jgi:cytochrome b6-f complex iron-sulfur subunit
MADPKKMTVAEMLAAARKADSPGGAAPAKPPAAPEPTASEPAAEAPAEAPAAAPTAEAKPKPAPAGKMSVAEMLAAARGEKAGGAASNPAAEKPAAAAKPAEPPAEKAPKPAAAEAKPAAAAKKAPAAAAATVDASSILAAARSAVRPGPMSKAEAVAKTVEAPAKPVKEKVVAPPMPARPAYAKPKEAAVDEDRRTVVSLLFGTAMGVGFTAMSLVGGLWSLALARFMFPNVLTEPPSRFKVGFPSNFPPGSVDEKFKAQFGVWITNVEFTGVQQIVALKSVCTHLGCTPNWLDGEQKFKCPCHGSGFYKDGINFEGPAPRPLERYAIRLADDGQLEVDKSKTFQEELGQWADSASFVPV